METQVPDNLPTLRCILFDMDGVLVDVSGSYRRAIIQTAEDFIGQSLPSDTVQQYKNRGGYNDDWELTHAIIRDHGVSAAFDDVVDAFQLRYRGRSFDGLIAIEAPIMTPDHLRELRRRATLGIVTGRPREEALWTVSHFGWKDAFQVLIAREDQDGRPKPDGYPLAKALSILRDRGRDHAPAEAGYVGDTVDDMQAAIAAGVKPIGFVPPYLSGDRHADVLQQSGAEIVLSDLSDLVGMVATSA